MATWVETTEIVDHLAVTTTVEVEAAMAAAVAEMAEAAAVVIAVDAVATAAAAAVAAETVVVAAVAVVEIADDDARHVGTRSGPHKIATRNKKTTKRDKLYACLSWRINTWAKNHK
jgi:hypothetical protein